MTDAVSVFVLPNLAFTAGILAVLVLRKPVRSQFGAKMAYALWLLPLLVLAASFLPPRVIEIAQSAPLFEAMPSGPEYVLPAAPAEAPPIAPVFIATAAPAFDPLMAALALWIAGAIAMFAWLGRRQALFMTDVRLGKAGPAVVGVFRPRIITPADFDMRFDESEKRVILTHETIHLARHDARINALVALLRCICWYNPLVHIGAHCMRIDQELACDAAVVERHPKARRLYADALLKAQLAARPLPLGCYWPAGTEHPLMERIEMLKQSAPGHLRRLAGAALLITLTAAAATAAWAAMPPTTRIIYEDPQQSPAPAAAQKVDYDWSNMVRIEGKVVAVNLDGSPPTVQVQGVQINSANPPDQLWTLDLTPKGRAPTQERNLDAAKVGSAITAMGYRVDKSCKSNCTLWIRNFNALRPDASQRILKLPVGIPDRFDANSDRMITVEGQIASIVKSGSDNIITVRAEKVRRGMGGPFNVAKPETGDWRFIQFKGATTGVSPFNGQATLGLQITATGLPEKNAACAAPCELAFFSSDVIVGPDGKPTHVRNLVQHRAYSAATMAPPADRHADTPSPTAQPGFNAEDYVVVRGTVVRVEGGNPVKTFWVKAHEINRNFEKTQANADTWRVDRLVPPGGAAPAEVRTGMDIRVDGYVSTICQPECRIQPMLIDLVQQQAAAEPQTAPAQPIFFNQQAAPANSLQAKPLFSPSPNQVPGILKGKITRIDLQSANSYVWVQAESIYWSRDGSKSEATNQLYRVMVGPKDQAPDWAARPDSIGAAVSVIVYEMKNASPCAAACDLGGWDVKLQSAQPAPKSVPQGLSCSNGGWRRPGIWGTCPPEGKPPAAQPILFDQQAAPANPPGVPPDWIPFAKYFDADKPFMLKGKVVDKGLFEGKARMLVIENASTRSGSAKEFTPDTRRWRVVLGAASSTPELMADALIGREITVRGYLAKDTSCDQGCLMNGRDITLTPLGAPAAQPTSTPIIPFMTGPRLQHADEPQKTADLVPEPSTKQLPDLIPFDRYFDVKTPVLLKGWVRKIETFEGHAALVMEEIEAQTPGYFHTPARDVKITWRVVLGRTETAPAAARDASLVGKVISVRGYSARDEKCDPECLMAGRDVYVGNETFSGWLAPRPALAKPKANAPPI